MTYRGFITRKEAGLRAPTSRSTNIDASRGGVTGHHAGSAQKVDTALSGHSRCISLWRGYQNYHMGKNWSDIAYTLGVCQHGYIFAGRGAGVRTAANGTNAGNSYWYAICWIGGGSEKPTQDAIDAFWEGVRMLRRDGNAGNRTNKHSDHKSTTCPGNLGPVIDAGEQQKEDGMLQRGDTGAEVKGVQEALLEFGASRADDARIYGNSTQTWGDARRYGADGDFGPTTELMVKSFQYAEGLTRTGRVDDETAKRLGIVEKEPASAELTPDKFAAEAWQWGIDNGLIGGPDHRYPAEPRSSVTKQEFIAILHRYDQKVAG